jgi:hypothetical protein
MKKDYIRFKKLRLILIAFGLLVIASSVYSAVNMDVTVDEIFFNYEDGNTNDALIISNDGTAIVNDAEWDSYFGETHKFAYIKGQSNRKIKVRFNPGSFNGLMHLLIKVTYITGHTDGIGTICNLFIPNFDPNADDSRILTLSGTLPGSVGVHEFQWHWEIYAIPINNPNYCAAWSTTNTSHHFYTLLAAPQAPMSQPWEQVLDYACSWASGQTNASVSASAVTNSLFNSGFVYDIAGSGAPHYGGFDQFNLSTFISHLGTPHLVNCLDMGKAVTTFGNALGCNLGLSTYGRTGISENVIDGPINCINPIGTTVFTNNPFGSPLIHHDCRSMVNGFSYHAFAESTSNEVWDATLSYDIDQDPENVINSNPNCGTATTLHSWQLPLNVPKGNYLTKLIDSWPKWYQQAPTLRRNRNFSIN